MGSDMGRIWLDSPDSKWEPLGGAFPSACLDVHPSGEFLAMQVLPSGGFTNERAAVWNTKTRAIHWNPGSANALCWIEGGNELLVLEESPDKAAIRPSVFATPTQAEYRHSMRRLSWPALDTISCLELEFPHGWLVDVVASPADALACFVWEDQCEAGIEFVSWEGTGLRQLPNIGHHENSNRIQGPVFSADGTVVVMTFGAGVWWAETPDDSSAGGKRNVGCIVWGKTKSGSYRRIDIDVSVPVGWQPEDPTDMLRNEFLSTPVFSCRHEVRIVLPTGEERFFPIAV
jgi:hypothetical protein